MENNIKSGYTEDIYANTACWYGKGAIHSFMELEELIEEKSMEEMLQRLKPLDFYLYMIRYLIEHYDVYLEKIYVIQKIKNRSKEDLVEEAYKEIQEKKEKKTIIKKLASLIYEDFKVHCKEADDILEQWSESKIIEKISAKRISVEKFCQLAIGIQMPYKDAKKFLRDVLKKGGFNFWDVKELLYYVCIRYHIENEFKFLKEKVEYYKEIVPEKRKEEREEMNTKWIGGEIDKLFQKIENSFTGEFEEEAFDEFLRNYKHWVTNSSDYTRTAVRIFRKLLNEFMEIAKKDIKEALEAKNSESEYAKGYVTIYYDESKEFIIPKGTIFLEEKKKKDKIEKISKEEENNVLEFQSTEDVKAIPIKSIVKELEVICTERTVIHAREEDDIGYVINKTKFECDVPGIIYAKNNSKFKAGKKIDSDQKTVIKGKLEIMAKPGTIIQKGTIFKAGETTFIAMKKLQFQAEVEVPVIAKSKLEEVKKNKITKISTKFDGKEYILGLSNKKITKVQRTGEKKGKFCGYVYTSKNIYGNYGRKETEKLGKLLKNVLEGKEILPARLSCIENQDNTIITRNELLTIAALHSMANLQFRNDNSGIISEEEKKKQMALQMYENMQRINSILEKCGFQQLYLANPYDCLITYIGIAEEPVYVFRELWGIYLSYEENLKIQTEE